MTIRLAIISDIHANLPALEAVLAEVDAKAAGQPFDAVYCLGDLGGYGSQPNEVQQLVMDRSYPTISGNYDENVGFERDDCGCHYTRPFEIEMSNISFLWTREHTTDENKAWLRSLPFHFEIRLEVEGQRVLLCHGSPRSDEEIITPATPAETIEEILGGVKERLVVGGHTHMQHRSGRYVNAGSVGMPYEDDVAAYWAVIADDVDFRRTPFDVERAIAETKRSAWPLGESFVRENLEQAPSRDAAIAQFRPAGT